MNICILYYIYKLKKRTETVLDHVQEMKNATVQMRYFLCHFREKEKRDSNTLT
jgi:hypothetical protein